MGKPDDPPWFVRAVSAVESAFVVGHKVEIYSLLVQHLNRGQRLNAIELARVANRVYWTLQQDPGPLRRIRKRSKRSRVEDGEVFAANDFLRKAQPGEDD